MENKKLTPGFFFLTLGIIATLITSVTAFLNLVFSTLDKALPDVVNSTYQFGYNSYDFDSIRGALATLIIAFPVYIVLSYFWTKYTYTKELSYHNSILRKWVIYLLLFTVAVTLLIDLSILIKYFISGEITLRFSLKVLAVLIVGVLSGFYYMTDLRREVTKKLPYAIVLIVLSSVLVIGSVIYSFSIMGSPMKQRALRFDQRRIEDLQNIQSQVISFWQQKEKLPETVESLIDPLNNYQTLPRDPEFAKGYVYQYKKTGNMSFDLCATFTLPIPQGWRENSGGVYPIAMPVVPNKGYADIAVSSSIYPGGAINENWDHKEGLTCFSRTVDPDRYPPFNKEQK